MATRDLLIEIGTEELPPKALSRLSSAFADQIAKQLQDLNLGFEDVERFATPRRLAVLVRDLEEAQQDNEKTRLGPAVKAAFDQAGQPTMAAAGFARSCGVDVADLARSDKDGTEKLAYTVLEKGQATTALIPDLLEPALSQLPIPKRMRWGSSRNEFVRPVHWLVVLFGNEAVAASVLGVDSGPATRGHRFHHNSDIPLGKAGAYEAVLRDQGKVIASLDKRREMIREQVLQEGDRLNATAVIDPDLLEEVTNLVEFPVALTGSFEEAFLAVPQEALILAMKSHQKCFYLTDSNGKLLPKFITISNIESTDPGQVIKGNERVIRPRLADAQFFYDTDKESPLESRQAALGKLIFQDKLGTVLDKSQRVGELATLIANQVDANPEHCQRAAQLSKCDLLTNMVGEFADLQGLMGSYYAEHDGEPGDVSKAIYEQYQPRFAGDAVPETLTGAVLAIADKLDSMVGLFGIGQPPTGSKDPFALRRAAIGLLRIIVEKQLSLDLGELIDASLKTYPADLLQAVTRTQVFDFVLERFRAWYLDKGMSSEEFQSVFVLKPSRPLDFHLRINAVHAFYQLPEAKPLAAANKRVANILAKQDSSDSVLALDESLLSEPAEKTLATEVQQKELEVAPMFDRGQYTEGLKVLSGLNTSVDTFFDDVMVMTDDVAVKNNRLALLKQLQSLFLRSADISHLHKS